MDSRSALKYIIAGFIMNLIAAVIPFLMILDFLDTTFFFSFLSFFLSVFGILIGFVGITLIMRTRKK